MQPVAKVQHADGSLRVGGEAPVGGGGGGVPRSLLSHFNQHFTFSRFESNVKASTSATSSLPAALPQLLASFVVSFAFFYLLVFKTRLDVEHVRLRRRTQIILFSFRFFFKLLFFLFLNKFNTIFNRSNQ